MASMISTDRLRFYFHRFQERLWVKPLAVCLLSILVVFAAKLADSATTPEFIPVIAAESIETLLSIMASSMLVIATFSVTSMVSAYSSASNTATPRSFTLVISDDASQNALSTFVGAFIFSIVALTAVKNDSFHVSGLFILYVLTAMVFAIVVVTFVRWVDRIARLGRLCSTIEKVEQATAKALTLRRSIPTLCGIAAHNQEHGNDVFATKAGYVQQVSIAAINKWAETNKAHVVIKALPGTFAAPDKPIAAITFDQKNSQHDYKGVLDAFQIGSDRQFEDDPRFGLVVLSEIAGRALSPAVNDPGTAIGIIGSLIRLFTLWSDPDTKKDENAPVYERVAVPELCIRDMFDDAFTAIARDGAGLVEVSVRLQKALHSLTITDNDDMRKAAEYHQQLALKRAKIALCVPEDFSAVQAAAELSN